MKTKVFISWSGERSKKVAEVFAKWTQQIIQNSTTFFSPDDIAKGSLWFDEIARNLNEGSIGLIFLTADNKDNPWILFEAGGLSKGLSSARVCSILIDIKPEEVTGPLSKFQLTKFQQDDILKLFKTINETLNEDKLADEILQDTFDDTWKKYDLLLKQSLNETESSNTQPPKRSTDDITKEILDIVRAIRKNTDYLPFDSDIRGSKDMLKGIDEDFCRWSYTCRIDADLWDDFRGNLTRIIPSIRVTPLLTRGRDIGNYYDIKFSDKSKRNADIFVWFFKEFDEKHPGKCTMCD